MVLLSRENAILRIKNGWVHVKPGEGTAWPKKADAHPKAPDWRGDVVCPCCNTRLSIAGWLAKSMKVMFFKFSDKLAYQLEQLDEKETWLPHDERK